MKILLRCCDGSTDAASLQRLRSRRPQAQARRNHGPGDDEISVELSWKRHRHPLVEDESGTPLPTER